MSPSFLVERGTTKDAVRSAGREGGEDLGGGGGGFELETDERRRADGSVG